MIEASTIKQSIAVVIPMYNAGRSVLRALESVFEQSLLPDEVIVVDDGSIDGSADLIAASEFASKVKVIRISNGGPSHARNKGIEQANSDWIAFLDADDYWINRDKLRAQMNIIMINSDVVLVDTFARIYWSHLGIIEATTQHQGDIFPQLLLSNVINATSSVMARREKISAVGGFNENIRFGEDRLLWSMLAKQGNIFTVPEFCIYKENHEDNLTARWQQNYAHRLKLTEALVQLNEGKSISNSLLIFKNLEEFLKIALRKRAWKMYCKFSKSVFTACPLRFLFSKYSLLLCVIGPLTVLSKR